MLEIFGFKYKLFSIPYQIKTLDDDHHRDKYTLCFLKVESWDHVYNSMDSFLSGTELAYFNKIASPKRKNNFLLGRFSAKVALFYHTDTGELEESLLKKISVLNGIMGAPYLIGSNLSLSFSHTFDESVSIITGPEIPVGIDLEKIDQFYNFSENYLNQEEQKLKETFRELPEFILKGIFWVAKEALSKFLKIGLTADYKVFFISQIEIRLDKFIVNFGYFPHIQCVVILKKNFIVSISFLKKTTFLDEGLEVFDLAMI